MKYCTVLHHNFEDIEGLAFIDILRRAGVSLDIYGIGSDTIKSRSGLVYCLDRTFNIAGDINPEDYAGLLIPGGPGSRDLAANTGFLSCVARFNAAGKLIFAICAAPMVLDRAGVLEGKNYTCYPGTEVHSGTRSDETVVVDGTIITSQGVGTALEAALKLVEIIVSKDESERQKKSVLYQHRM